VEAVRARTQFSGALGIDLSDREVIEHSVARIIVRPEAIDIDPQASAMRRHACLHGARANRADESVNRFPQRPLCSHKSPLKGLLSGVNPFILWGGKAMHSRTARLVRTSLYQRTAN
jgi:hypothetical protein